MRTFSAAALIMLAACTQDATGTPPDDENLVECALSGSTAFSRDCAVERWREGNGAFLVVRHPDGGFRSLQVLEDGGLHKADGAEAARDAPLERGSDVDGVAG